MGEFRIGRTRAQHSYPEAQRGGAGVLSLARNFAQAEKVTVPISDAGTQIPWGFIESVDAWDATVTYGINDIVSFDGTTWISLQAGNLNNSPPLEGAGPTAFWAQNTAIPITPRSSGVVVVTGSLSIDNGEATEQTVAIGILQSGTVFPVNSPVATLNVDDNLVTFVAEITGLSIGITEGIAIVLTAAAGITTTALDGNASVVEVHEVIEATG